MGIVFFVYYVLLVDIPGFYRAAFSSDFDPHRSLGMPFNDALRYHGALVLVAFLYALMVIATPSKRLCAGPLPHSETFPKQLVSDHPAG